MSTHNIPEEIKQALEKDYPLIPMSEITDEARIIAVAWMECGDKNWIGQKHKLASDIMNYARRQSADKDKVIDHLEEGCNERDREILEQKQEVKKHVDKFKEMLTLIDRYRKEVEMTSTGNHVYNEIMQHLILTKNY